MDTNFRFIADGEKIKKLRTEKGFHSTYELAKYVGVAPSTITTIEQGTRSNCYVDSIARIAIVLEVSMEELLKKEPLKDQELSFKSRKKLNNEN